MIGFGWLKKLFETKPQPAPRPASVMCHCCEGWSHTYSANEMEKCASDFHTSGSFFYWTCGRCNTVSEWLSGPAMIFIRMVSYGTTALQLLSKAEDLEAEYNLLLLEVPEELRPKPIWTNYANLDYTGRQEAIALLEKEIIKLKLLTVELLIG